MVERWRCLSGLLATAAVAVVGCGPSIPHDGYKSPRYKPWKSPKVLEFDEDNEAEYDNAVDYRRRKRAKWVAVDLPNFGKLEVKLNVEPLDEGTDIDLAFEILNSSYRVLEAADRDEDDSGDLKKKRELDDLDAGRYYIHIYAQRKLDRADFSVRVKFASGLKEYESTFPSQVPYVGILPAVPLFDDTPAAPRKVVRRRRPTVKPSKSVRGRIAGLSTTGKGTFIKIDRGSAQGVAKGWRGVVISKSGKAIQSGGFTVSKVSASESYGTVRATQDAVNAAKYVRLSPP